MDGKLVLNILPARASDKGKALLAMQRRLKLPYAIYVGDDVTDEDVFALGRPRRLLGIVVGDGEGSKASFRLPRQREIDRLLEAILKVKLEPGKLNHEGQRSKR
jgi:trehalose 6-phosphate phosphatase